MTDKAIAWVRQQRSLMTAKPFLMYYAPGATHAPHHVPEAWADKYKGRFDAGWDAVREEIFARQQELGVIPADAELTARPAEIPAYADMPEELKPVLARQMEIYAGFLEHTDHHLGRLIDALEDMDVLDDTLVYYIIGDNGASAEGQINGTFNETLSLNGAGALETAEFMASRIDLFGGPEAYNHYAVGWAHAMCTPYQWTKQVASHWGGTRNGTIVHWPNGFDAKGEIRTQFHHVIDVAPTVLDAAGIPAPTFVNGIQQQPIEGTSMRYAFADAGAGRAPRDPVLRDVLQPGHLPPGLGRGDPPQHAVGVRHELPAFDDDVWELYDTTTDWTQAHDLAAAHPDKLHELQRLFLIEATKYNVLPLDDRRVERFNSDLAGRPVLIKGNSQILFGNMGRISENSVLNLKNKSHSVTAEIVVPAGGGHGVIVAQGGAFAGWALYLIDGHLKYCHNLAGLARYVTTSTAPVPPGDHQVRMEFTYDGGGVAKGGDVTLFVDGTEAGVGRVDATVPMLYSADETCDVGQDTGSAVSDDYTPETSRFTGKVHWVQLDIDEAAEDLDHLISPDERLRVAMARQ